MRWAINRYAASITGAREAFIEITMLWKSSRSQMRMNSRADSTIPSGVSP